MKACLVGCFFIPRQAGGWCCTVREVGKEDMEQEKGVWQGCVWVLMTPSQSLSKLPGMTGGERERKEEQKGAAHERQR